MKIITLQQIIDERISFLKEQINPENKPQVNKTFQLQIEAIRSVDDDYADEDKVETIIKMCICLRGCLQSLMVWNGCSDR
jgi:hypothetical protein